MNRFLIKPLEIAYLLPLIVLIEGFVSVAIEIITIRQLLPVVGGSVAVTSLIIGIFLLFLAFGYRRGGQHDKGLIQKLCLNFLLAAIWLGIGLSYIFIAAFFTFAESMVGIHTNVALLVYLIVILAPLIFVLGQTVPVAMNLTRQDKRAGTIGGNALGLSTIGSFLGATVTALLWMPYLGIAYTIFINVLLLVLLTLLISKSEKNFWFYFFIAICTLLIVYFMNVSIEKNMFVRTNNYGNYQVINLEKDAKMLIINNSYSSLINSEKKGFPYVELIKKVLFQELQFRNKNILVLGAGGFSLSAENNFNNHITYVDIDNQIKDIVVPKFLNYLRDQIIFDDARHFIRTTNKKYDAIVVDAYTNLRAIPAFLLTHEFMQQLKDHVIEKGVIILNIIAKADFNDVYSKRVDNTIRSALNSCAVIPLNYSEKVTNIIYVCQRNQEQHDPRVYTDDLNTSSLDAFGV